MDSSQEVCVICLDTMMESRAILKECQHVFCTPCIEQWTDIRMKCPICNKELTSMKSNKKIMVVQSSVDASEEEFDCLDHNYFKKEFQMLQIRLNDTKFVLRKDAKLSKYNNAWDALEMTQFELTQKLKDLEDFKQFCPKNYLADVYRIDQCLKDIASGSFAEKNFMQPEKLKQDKNDFACYNQNEEEYHEYEGDYYDESQILEDADHYTYYSCVTLVDTKKKAKKKKNQKKTTSGSTGSQTRVKN